MKVPATEAVPIIDPGDNLIGFTLQNNDPANDVWISMNGDELNTQMSALGVAGTAPKDSDAIKIAAGGGSITIHFFSGKYWARAVAATVNIARQTWPCILR